MAIYGYGYGAQKLDGCNMAAIKRRSNISLGRGGGGGEINAQIAFVARTEVGIKLTLTRVTPRICMISLV